MMIYTVQKDNVTTTWHVHEGDIFGPVVASCCDEETANQVRKALIIFSLLKEETDAP